MFVATNKAWLFENHDPMRPSIASLPKHLEVFVAVLQPSVFTARHQRFDHRIHALLHQRIYLTRLAFLYSDSRCTPRTPRPPCADAADPPDRTPRSPSRPFCLAEVAAAFAFAIAAATFSSIPHSSASPKQPANPPRADRSSTDSPRRRSPCSRRGRGA